jgi:hypothetical protein
MQLLIRKFTEVFYYEKYLLQYLNKSTYLKLILNLNQPVEKVRQVILFK